MLLTLGTLEPGCRMIASLPHRKSGTGFAPCALGSVKLICSRLQTLLWTSEGLLSRVTSTQRSFRDGNVTLLLTAATIYFLSCGQDC